MRPYAREEWKRSAETEAVSGLFRREAPDETRRPDWAQGPRPGFPGYWARFLDAFEASLSETGETTLRSFADCTRLGVWSEHRCGSEQPQAEAWCGSSYCPACAHQATGAATREARTWSQDDGERFVVVDIPIGRPGGLELPTHTAVVTVRDAWSRATKFIAERSGLTRLDPMPRSVLTPDGLVAFVKAPAEAAELFTQDVTAGAQQAGLRVQAKIVDGSAAAVAFGQAVGLEGQRFAEGVCLDLIRLRVFGWRSPRVSEDAIQRSSRRWVEQVRARHATRRRQVILGGKSALPFASHATAPSAACREHGGLCPVDATVVRDHAASNRALLREPGQRFQRAPRRQEIEAFLRQARPAAAVTAPIMLRKAG
jgi:hypothetical protein